MCRVITLLLLATATLALNTPVLVGEDAFTPPFTYCNREDTNNLTYVTQCDYYRSDGCNIDTYRCTLAAALSFVNTSAQLITFDTVTYAAWMTGYADGAMRINLRYTDLRFNQLSGVLQLFKRKSGNIYNYYKRQHEVNYAATFDDQTYYFQGLEAGVYVAVYWDDGGTRMGYGAPEISQFIEIYNVITQRASFPMSAIAGPSMDTNYQRVNRNHISYQITGPTGFQTVITNACTNPLYNRCPSWELRSDQGNIINAKTELETVPAWASGAGFVDTMYKFKIFPIMGNKNVRVAFRLNYGGAYPFFPTSYFDYFDDRMNFGRGTIVAQKLLQFSRVYLDDNLPYCPFSPCVAGTTGFSQRKYQKLVSQNYPSAQYPACVKDTPALNTLAAVDATTDLYTVRTLHHNYCECTKNATCNNNNKGPPADTVGVKDSENDNVYVDWHIQYAFRKGLDSETNNFDQYEDWKAMTDIPYINAYYTQMEGYVGGRMFRVDALFAERDNSEFNYTTTAPVIRYGLGGYVTHTVPVPVARSGLPFKGSTYSCHYTTTKDTSFLHPDNGVVQPTCAGTSLFADIYLDRSDFVNFNNAGEEFTRTDCSLDSSCGTDEGNLPANRPERWIDNTVVGGIFEGHFGKRCNAKYAHGHYTRRDDLTESLRYPFYDPPYAMTMTETSYFEAWFTEDFYWLNNYNEMASRMACWQIDTPDTIEFPIEMRTPLVGSTDDYLNTDWHGNKQAVVYQDTIALFTGRTDTPYVDVLNAPLSPNVLVIEHGSTAPAADGVDPFCRMTVAITSPIPANCLQSLSGNLRWLNFFLKQQLVVTDPYLEDIITLCSGEIPSAQTAGIQMDFTDRNGNKVFGVYGLDVFVGMAKFAMTDTELTAAPPYDQHYEMRYTFPTYPRYKVIPTIEFYAFGSIDFGDSPVYQPSIEITFRVSCPNVDMDPTNNHVTGHVGYCAQNWVITNQFDEQIYMYTVSGPSVVSEPQSNLPFGFTSADLLGDVYTDAVITVRILYNDGDVIRWRFFPKVEPEQPVDYLFCGMTDDANTPAMVSSFTVRTPTMYRALQLMIARCKSVPPACEYNSPEMFLIAFRGEPFVYAASIEQNIPRYEVMGRPLDYGLSTNYWIRWNINGQRLEGMSVASQPYAENSYATVYDQKTVLYDLFAEPPITIATYTNPLLRAVGCQNYNATCYTPYDDTNNTAYSGIDQNHYCIDGEAGVLLRTRLVYIPPFTEADQVGAIYCNKTTEFIDVFIQSQKTKALFGIVKELDVKETGDYTCTVRYGKSLIAILDVNYPCYERLITYAIVLTPFQIDTGTLTRIPACDRADNCCYYLPIIVSGNTGDTEDTVNLASCSSQPECQYEIIYSPSLTNDTFMGMCLGRTYTITVQSPAVMVANREQATVGTFFQYPWRCPSSKTVTLPKESFSPIDVAQTVGSCVLNGNFLEFAFTYTNPVCINAITVANANPECRYRISFAVEKVGGPAYTQTQARLGNPFVLQGLNSVSYNSRYVINFPAILNDPAMPVLKEGTYDLYIWMAPAATPSLSYAAALALDARLAIKTRFINKFDENNGLKVYRTTVTTPQCPATFNDTLNLPAADVAINIGISIIDTNWNGPYEVVFRTPSGLIISDNNITTEAVCPEYCGALLIPANQSCAACDIGVQVDGIQRTLLMGTGVSSPGEYGNYFVTITSAVTGCVVAYGEPFVVMDSFVAEVTCRPQTCETRQDGVAYSNIEGGTLIPLTLNNLVQNSDLTVATPRYRYEWTVYYNNATNTTKYANQTYLPNIVAGTYTLTATDYNGCVATATCVLEPVNNIRIQLVGVTQGNCSYAPGSMTVEVVNNTGRPPYYLYEVGPNPNPIATTNGYVLSASTVKAGQKFYYTVCDATLCCSPIFDLTINATAEFTVRLSALRLPCSDFLNSGIVTANVFPIGSGVTLQWFYNDVAIPSFSGFTYSAAATGIYKVIGTNLAGCVASDIFVLTSTGNLDFTFNRSPINVSPGKIQGTVSGGNGAPYTMQLLPPDSLVPYLEQDVQFTSFRIENVAPSATIKIRFTDSGGCVVEKLSDGVQTPITTPPVTASQSPAPFMVKHEPPPDLYWVYMVAIFMGCFVLITCLALIYDWKNGLFAKDKGDKFKRR